MISESTKSTNDNDFDDFVRAPVTSNIGNTNGSNNNGQFISNSNDLEQLGTAFGSSNPSTGEKENTGVMSKDCIMALFNKPRQRIDEGWNCLLNSFEGFFLTNTAWNI